LCVFIIQKVKIKYTINYCSYLRRWFSTRIIKLIPTTLIALFIIAIVTTGTVAAEVGELTPPKETAFKWIDENMDYIWSVAVEIWRYAEVSLQEFKSSKLLADVLEEAGFTVERGVAGLPTAFVATWGSGEPVIGILAEYDALPGLSNSTPGQPGHGCGHNLFGTASVFGAIALKEAMEKHGLKGTIKVFGTPAEEILYGKVIMVAAGLFEGVDAVIDWHPSSITGAAYTSTNALDNKIYRFYGKTAHAGGAPWQGRSALDAALLFTEAIERIREHMWEKDRIHYVITKGGEAPNIVPDYAEVHVFIRAPDMNHFVELSQWVDAAALGAALATQTKVEIERVVGCHLVVPNKVLNEVIYKNLLLIGPPKWDAEDYEFIKTQLSRPYEKLSEEIAEFEGWDIGEPWQGTTASTDSGDVSWVVPRGTFRVACAAIGTPWHHIDVTEQVGSRLGYKCLNVATKVIAASAIDLLTHPDIIEKAWEELNQRKQLLGWEYKPFLPGKIKYPEYPLTPEIEIKPLAAPEAPTVAVEEEIAKIKASVEELSSSVEELSGSVEELRTKVSDLESLVSTVKSDLAAEVEKLSEEVKGVASSTYSVAVACLIGGIVLGVGLAVVGLRRR